MLDMLSVKAVCFRMFDDKLVALLFEWCYVCIGIYVWVVIVEIGLMIFLTLVDLLDYRLLSFEYIS